MAPGSNLAVAIGLTCFLSSQAIHEVLSGLVLVDHRATGTGTARTSYQGKGAAALGGQGSHGVAAGPFMAVLSGYTFHRRCVVGGIRAKF